MNHLADALPDPRPASPLTTAAWASAPTERLAERLAVVIPFPVERRRDPAEAEARRRHPSARTI